MPTCSWRIRLCGIIVSSVAACTAAGQDPPPQAGGLCAQEITSLSPAEQAACTAQKTATDALAKANAALEAAQKANATDTQAAQQSAAAARNAATAAQNAAGAAAQAASTAKSATDTAAQAASVVNKARQLLPESAVPGNADPPLLGDHVPCLMDKKELFSLRGIGPDDAGVKDAIIKATARVCDPSKDPNCQRMLSQSISQKSWRGLSTAQRTVQLRSAAVEANLTPAQQQQVVDAGNAAATEAATFKRPTDLGCSMSIMPWKEASKVFGRAVANTFLAVQVVVRNMDDDHDFLLHDAELAVDAYSSAVQRFQAGHEKEVVRGVSVWGQAYGRHAVAVHIVEGPASSWAQWSDCLPIRSIRISSTPRAPTKLGSYPCSIRYSRILIPTISTI